MPQRLTRINVAYAGYPRLVEKEVLQRAGRSREQLAKVLGSEFTRKRVHSQGRKPRRILERFPIVHAAKVAAVRKSQYATWQFERHVNMRSVIRPVRAPEHFLCIRKPDQLTVQPEVQANRPASQIQQEVFSFAMNSANVLPRDKTGQITRWLRFRCNGMKHINAANPLALHERAQGPCDCFDFGKFRHESGGISYPASV